jgi:hypothetical protein
MTQRAGAMAGGRLDDEENAKATRSQWRAVVARLCWSMVAALRTPYMTRHSSSWRVRRPGKPAAGRMDGLQEAFPADDQFAHLLYPYSPSASSYSTRSNSTTEKKRFTVHHHETEKEAKLPPLLHHPARETRSNSRTEKKKGSLLRCTPSRRHREAYVTAAIRAAGVNCSAEPAPTQPAASLQLPGMMIHDEPACTQPAPVVAKACAQPSYVTPPPSPHHGTIMAPRDAERERARSSTIRLPSALPSPRPGRP